MVCLVAISVAGLAEDGPLNVRPSRKEKVLVMAQKAQLRKKEAE